jgi:hypothetical protein
VWRRVIGLLAGTFASMVVAVPSGAKEQGIFVEPDSPSGKEYAVPLESARRAADPTGDPSAPVRPGESSAPLFGRGITGPREQRARSGGRKPPLGDILSRQPAASEALRIATAHPGAPGGGTNAAVVASGVAALILLAGGLIGLVLRRRSAGR